VKAPAFQWYPKDCDTDENVRLMNDEEFGVYVRCLNHAWLNDGLPTDLRDLRRLFDSRGTDGDEKTTEERRENDGRKRRDRFNSIWKRVGKCFFLDESTGRLRNPKQEEQRVAHEEFRESRRNAAKARWDKQVHNECNARASEMQCSAISNLHTAVKTDLLDANLSACFDPASDEPFSLNGNATHRAARLSRSAQLAAFDEFWSVVWVKIGRGAARRSWLARVKTPDLRDRVIAAAKRQAAGILQRAADTGSTPLHPATWLNQERYDDEECVMPDVSHRTGGKSAKEAAWERA
jgi:hypothetical protein